MKKKETTILDYSKEVTCSFKERPFNNVDSLILSWLSYLRFENNPNLGKRIPLSSLTNIAVLNGLTKDVYAPEKTIALVENLRLNPRFSSLVFFDLENSYAEEAEEQFYAITIQIAKNLYYISFRGTDSTFVGWKEDLNMNYVYPIPSQKKALAYFERQAKKHPKAQFYLGGHSKGGNLSLYAAVLAKEETNRRIITAYSHDGPGFLPIFEEEKYFLERKEKLNKTVPQSSIVGMLLERQNLDIDIVKSNRTFIFQHDPFSWQTKGNDFEYMDRLTGGAKFMDSTINKWIISLDKDRRERFVNTLYQLLLTTNLKTTKEFKQEKFNNTLTLVKSIGSLDKETKDFLLQTLSLMMTMTVDNFKEKKGKETNQI